MRLDHFLILTRKRLAGRAATDALGGAVVIVGDGPFHAEWLGLELQPILARLEVSHCLSSERDALDAGTVVVGDSLDPAERAWLVRRLALGTNDPRRILKVRSQLWYLHVLLSGEHCLDDGDKVWLRGSFDAHRELRWIRDRQDLWSSRLDLWGRTDGTNRIPGAELLAAANVEYGPDDEDDASRRRRLQNALTSRLDTLGIPDDQVSELGGPKSALRLQMLTDALQWMYLVYAADEPDDDDEYAERIRLDLDWLRETWYWKCRDRPAAPNTAWAEHWFEWPSIAFGGGGIKSKRSPPPDGIMSKYGYSVAQGGYETERERQAVLSRIFSEQLKHKLTDYLTEWGDPGTPARLQKMAKSLTGFIAWHSMEGHALAVARWTADLAWLKAEYYENYFGFRDR